MIDVHAHLGDGQFEIDFVEVLDRAWGIGVEHVVVVTETEAEFMQSIEKMHSSSSCHTSWLPGLHPCRVAELGGAESSILALRRSVLLAQSSSLLVGVGEVGLDFSRHVVGVVEGDDHHPLREAQRAVFAEALSLSARHGVFVNVHSRSAGHHAIEQFMASDSPSALFHAFDGRAQYAVEAITRRPGAVFFSIPPSCTRSEAMDNLIKRLPLDALCLESDSPALGPVQGQRNEPQNITLSRDHIAKLKGVSPEQVAQATTQNAKRLLRLLHRKESTLFLRHVAPCRRA
jgi:TatD DNase family protein